MMTSTKTELANGKQKPIAPGHVALLPIEMLAPDPEQPRTIFDEAALQALATDIKLRGVEQPILIRSDGFQYLIKHGERRWRAARIAGLKTVPCLLAVAADDKRPEVERLLDQAADNHHQENLSPIEWGQVCKRLVEQHGLAVKDIPEELERRGIRSMSRPYISNLMRLTELPDWAQALINADELTASDGKALLMAKPYPPAMAWLKKEMDRESKVLREGQRLRDALYDEYGADNMEDLVDQAYVETAITLTRTYGDRAPLFKWETSCKTCPERQKVQNDHYCLNAKCFGIKQDKARAEMKAKGKSEKTALRENRGESPKPKKATEPTKINPKKVSDDGVVTIGKLNDDKYHFLDDYDVRFAPAIHCVGCEFNRPAVQTKGQTARACCFNIPHFDQLQRNGNREEGIAQWLDQRILPEVLAKVTADHELQFQLMAWMALHAPVQNEHDIKVRNVLEREQTTARRALNITTPAKLIQRYKDEALDVSRIAAGGVRAMMADRANFYAFARHLGIAITPAMASIDDVYVDLKRKGELLTLLKGVLITTTQSAGVIAVTTTGQNDLDALSKKKLDEVVEVCLLPEVIEQIGVPPDVKALYERIEPIVDDMHEDVYFDEDDVHHPSGKCRICGCTETTPCLGEDGPCAWLDGDQTLCSNPECVAAANQDVAA